METQDRGRTSKLSIRLGAAITIVKSVIRKLSRQTPVVVLALVSILALITTTSVLARTTDTAPLLFVECGRPAGGQVTLVRNGALGMISARINATHLNPGHAYTYWWVIFNDPSQCLEPFVCGEADIFIDPDDHMAGFNLAQIAAVRVASLGGSGEIANHGGQAQFTGALFEDSALPLDVLIGPAGLFDFGNQWLLEDAMQAQIIIILRDHGPTLSGADLAAQLHTFTGNCLGLDPNGTYMCFEPQFSPPR
jgi:hypothetical protein